MPQGSLSWDFDPSLYREFSILQGLDKGFYGKIRNAFKLFVGFLGPRGAVGGI